MFYYAYSNYMHENMRKEEEMIVEEEERDR